MIGLQGLYFFIRIKLQCRNTWFGQRCGYLYSEMDILQVTQDPCLSQSFNIH